MKYLKFVFAYLILFCITGFSQSIQASDGADLQRRLSFVREANAEVLSNSMKETQAREQLWQSLLCHQATTIAKNFLGRVM